MRIFLAGATGMIGGPLVARLRDRGDSPVVLTRSARSAAAKLGEGVELVEGDPCEYGDWARAVDGCQAVVNLTGEPLFGKRWNAAQKELLRTSRIESTRNVGRAIAAAARPPAVLANASAIGYYGDVPEGELTEKSPPGDDFLARLCVDWEAAAMQAARPDVRVAVVRVGVVLGPKGGAISQMLTPFKLGLGGPVGRGRQWLSWVHVDDVVGAFLTVIDHDQASGPINGTAPQPVRNKEFSRCLAAALHRPCLIPVPPPALRLMMGEVAWVVATGQRVLPTRLEYLGYRFRYPTCAEAMQAIFAEEKS